MVSAAHTPGPLANVAQPSSAQSPSPPSQAPASLLKLVDSHVSSVGDSGARRRLRTTLTILHAAVGVAALVGGAALIVDPTGSPMGLTTGDLHGFGDFFIPGIVLLMLAFLQLFTAVYTRRPGAAPMTTSHWAGAFVVLFVAFQSALVLPLLPFSLAVGLVGAFIYALANELHRDEPHTPLLP